MCQASSPGCTSLSQPPLGLAVYLPTRNPELQTVTETSSEQKLAALVAFLLHKL